MAYSFGSNSHVNTFSRILTRNTNGYALRVKKGYHCTAVCLTSPNPTDLHSYFTSRLSSQFAIKQQLKMPAHLEYAAALPCDLLLSIIPDSDCQCFYSAGS